MFARLSMILLVLFAATTAQAQPKDLRWGGPAVGTSGHKALIALAAILNKEMPDYRIAVLPFPGASDSVKSYALGETDAFYASQVAFHELATDSGRFRGFRAAMKREPLQSFWGFTVEVGMAIRPRDRDTIRSWSDLAAKRTFTCPLTFDTHAHLERAFAALGLKHRYIQVDLSTVGSQLRSGLIDAMCVYTSAESAPPPWLAEASLSADWAVLNPSAAETATLKDAGFSFIGVSPAVFGRDIHAEQAMLSPILSGFGVTPDMPAADLARLLTIVEAHIGELAQVDQSYAQLARDLIGMQRRGIATSPKSFGIHAGLARFLRERNAWDSTWDAQVVGR